MEALFAIALVGVALAAGVVLAHQGFTAARASIDGVVTAVGTDTRAAQRGGQATVEVVVLFPLLALAVVLLVGGWMRLADVGRAERAVGAAQAAIAAGEPIGTLGRRWNATIERREDRLVVRVPSPLVDVVRDVEVPAVP
jgi:hypothetical protein